MAVYHYTTTFKIQLNNTANDAGQAATETMMSNIKADIEQYLSDNGASGDVITDWEAAWLNLSE
tara:strand:+ start:120 stop:311 length:192 start_codon:yes stop_codon:yes gene_type:complete